MRKTVVLSINEKRMFPRKCISSEYENVTVLSIRNSLRAIGKLRKTFCGTNIVVKVQSRNEKILKDKLTEYSSFSYKETTPVINKIFRQTAYKFKKELPVEEVYILGSSEQACAFAAQLNGLCRVFTVVSEQNPVVTLYDELYFKYGLIIRHIPSFGNITEDSVVIRCNPDWIPSDKTIPVIDFSDEEVFTENVVKAGNILVYDEKIAGICKCFGGKSGLALYSLFGEIPSENAEVDINKSADKIFLLDTNQI